MVFVCSRIYFEICSRICLKICHAKIYFLKNHGLLKFVSGAPLGGRPDKNSGRPWNLNHSLPCRTPCGLFIHEVLFGPLGLNLRVWSELGRSPPFCPMRALKLHWSWPFSLVCEVALKANSHPNTATLSQNTCDWKDKYLGQYQTCGRQVLAKG